MSGSKTRQVLAVVVAVAVVWSVAGAPVAAAEIDSDSDSGLTGLSSDSPTTDSSSENDTTNEDDADGTDETGNDTAESSDDTSDGEDANGTDDGTNDQDGSTNNETDGSSDDSSGDDSTLRGNSTDDSDSDNESDDSSDDRPTERVESAVNETVEETTETVENSTEDVPSTGVFALDVDEDSVTETAEEVVENVQLESALGVGVLELVEPLPTGAEAVDRTHTYDETVDTNRDEPPTATETAADDGSDEADDETAAAAVGTSGDEQPDPADPAGAGAAMGLGALATAAALRGSPILIGSKAASSSGWFSNLLDRVRPFVFPLRYSRYDDSDPLEHEARERVYEIVNDTPGSYLSEVSQEAGLPLSTTRHHIKVLEREDLVTGAKLHGKRRFFPAYAEGIELAAALNDDSTANIIDAIARIGAASVSDLADELDRDPSTISHHLQRLEDDGVITRERDGRAVVSKLSAEARTALEPETTPETGEVGEVAAGSAD